MSKLTHINKKGEARMVDVSLKKDTIRKALAEGRVAMQKSTFELIKEKGHKKGDVLAVARLAGILAAKQTQHLIPLCHSISLESVEINFELDELKHSIKVSSTCISTGKTGVEMEALTAVSLSCLTIYDMCKAVDRSMVINEISLLKKSGGKSGTYNKK